MRVSLILLRNCPLKKQKVEAPIYWSFPFISVGGGKSQQTKQHFCWVIGGLCSGRRNAASSPSPVVFNEWYSEHVALIDGGYLSSVCVWLIYHLFNMQDSNQQYGDINSVQMDNVIFPLPFVAQPSCPPFLCVSECWDLKLNVKITSLDKI